MIDYTLEDSTVSTDFGRTPRIFLAGLDLLVLPNVDVKAYRRALRPVTRALSALLTDAGVDHRSVTFGFKAGGTDVPGWKINGSSLPQHTVFTPTVIITEDEEVAA